MTRQNRFRLSAATVGLAALVVAGCSVPTNDPESYDSQVQANFVAGCTGADPIVDNTTSTIASQGVCQCDFAVFVAMVPYNDNDKGKPQYAGYSGKTFVEINNELKRDGTKFNDASIVPQNVRDKLKECNANQTAATLPSNFSTGTTGPGGSTPGSSVGTTPGSTPGSELR